MRNIIFNFNLVIKMHILQPKHTKIGQQETKELLAKFNINPSQLPKIKKNDPALPVDIETGNIVKIERKSGGNKIVYYRVVL
jgi:DNA-directed RNA polymerase subunit H